MGAECCGRVLVHDRVDSARRRKSSHALTSLSYPDNLAAIPRERTPRAAPNRPAGHRGPAPHPRVALLVMVGRGDLRYSGRQDLSAGGFQDPTSESAKATQLLAEKFDQGDMQLLITVTATRAASQSRGAHAAAPTSSTGCSSRRTSRRSMSAWTAPPPAAAGTDQQGRQDRASSSRASPAARTTPRSTPRNSPTSSSTTATASPCEPAARRWSTRRSTPRAKTTCC